jgi:seryl-tRNA synthetase
VAASKGEEKAAFLARTKELAVEVKAAEVLVGEKEAELRAAQFAVPNLVQGAPAGGEDDYLVIRTVGEVQPAGRDHLELGELLGAVDMERGAKVSGSRFYFLTGLGALLQLGLLQLGMNQAVEYGFTPVIPPTLVKPESMEGTGFLGAHASEIYHLPADDLYLVGTSEVPLAAYHKDEILNLDAPRRYAGWSSCFRREAGSYGKDTRGIIRVHQFDKVEMFSYCLPEQAAEEHLRLLAWEEELLSKLELAYRVIDVAAGDLGSSAARKFDCEAWLPSQQAYREVTSTSNCTTFQARRLGVRYRDAEGKTQPVATLNGTLATTRMLVPLLEQHQQADGSVRVPKALQPFLGGRDVLTP